MSGLECREQLTNAEPWAHCLPVLPSSASTAIGDKRRLGRQAPILMGMNLSGRALPQDRFLVGTKSHHTVNAVSIPARFGFDQHVARAEQVFGTKFIKDDERLGPALDG